MIRLRSGTAGSSTASTQSLAAAASALGSATSVWIGTHLDPDGDAVGSLLGLALLLRQAGKRVTAACRDGAPNEVRFLPGSSELVTAGPEGHDVAVALDTADFGRLGSLVDAVQWSQLPTIVIDHHRSNRGFGDIDVIDPEAASTAQILVSLADSMGLAIAADVATCWLTGIVTDTLGFRTSNTSLVTVETAARLMRLGASLPEISQAVFYRRPITALTAVAMAVSKLTVDGRVGVVTLGLEEVRAAGLTDQDLHGVSSILVTANELDAVAVVRERDDGSIDVSMRSKLGVDLVPAADMLGGGGHPQAAGASLDGPLAAAAALVARALTEAAERGAASGRAP